MPSIGREWHLTFSVKPTGTKNFWSNLIQLTEKTGNNIPGVWFNSDSTSLHICSIVNENKKYCWDSHNLPLNKFTKVDILQTCDAPDTCAFIIGLDNEVKHAVINNHKGGFKNVIFYASNAWNDAAKAILKDVAFTNLKSGETINFLLKTYEIY